jgi:hypothetical protein
VKSSATHHTSRTTPRILCIAFLFLMVIPSRALASQETVAVTGYVTNGTAGAAVPQGLPVTLFVFLGVEETDTYTSTLAADGSFAFDAVKSEPGATFVAQVSHAGVAYYSQTESLQMGQQALYLSITIYETTSDPSAVAVTQLHIFVAPSEESLQITEYYLVGNSGDRTYAGERHADTGRQMTVSFTLPAGAENLRFDGPGIGYRYEEQAAGFVDTHPVPPGAVTVEALFSYDLAASARQITRVFDLPIRSVVLTIAEEHGTLEGEELSPAGQVDTQAGKALSYVAGPLQAGQPLSFRLSRRSSEGQDPATGGLALGLVALAGSVLATYLLWRSPTSGTLPARARPTIEAIAALDGEFEGGQADAASYQHVRQTLKEQLHVLLADRANSDD